MDLTSKIDTRLLATTGAGRRTQAARQRKSLANYQKFRETLKPGGASFSTHYKEDTIILDIGGRYSKVGFVGEPTPRRICRTNLYLGDERKSKPYFGQKFKAGVKLRPVVLSLSKVPQSPQTWQEISELLVDDLLFNQLEIKPDKRRIIVLQDPWWPIAFQNALCQSFFRHQCPGVQFVDSLHCAVFSTGQDTALVVDVGYHCTKIEATMFGHIIPESLSWSPIGFYSVMSEFKILMRESTKLDFDKFRVEDEQIEKAIARTCFVQPKRISKDSNNNNSESSNFHPKSVSYEFNVRKQSAFCKIAPSIRRKSCQVLFDPERRNVVHFICDTLLKLPIDCRGALVNNILLTGGTVSLPGFESRFIEEWKDAMKLPKYKELSNLGHRMRLIKSSFEPNTRMFVGASIYANITNRFADELFITREQFEELKKNRIEDWSEISTLRYNEYVSSKKEEYNKLSIIDIEASSSSQSVIAAKKDFQNAAFLKCLTHVDIIRKPQHRKARQQFVGSKLTGAGGAAAANSPYRSTVIGGGFSGRKRVSFGASGGTGTGSSNYGGRGTLGAGLLGKSALSGLSSDTSGLTKSASFDPSLRNAGGLSYSKSVPKDSDGKSLLMKSVLDPNDETDALDELNEGLQNKSDTNRMTQAMRLDTDRSEPAPKDDEETPK